MKVCIVLVKGGLGNQMFGYATARALAEKNGAKLYIDPVSCFQRDKYNRSYRLHNFKNIAEILPPSFCLRSFRPYLVRYDRFIKNLGLKSRFFIQNGVDFDPKFTSIKIPNGLSWVEPFGQSEKYFSEIKHKIAHEFSVCPPNNQFIDPVLSENFVNNTVAIHLRTFEQDQIGSSIDLSISYYARAISFMKNRLENPIFYVFSNDVSYAKYMMLKIFNKEDCVSLISSSKQDDLYDFNNMRLCKHFIISNSTFSWWAAWLSEVEHGGVVVAPNVYVDPKKHISAWGFDELIPPRWTLL